MSKPFNWSLLDRYNLHTMLYSAGKYLIGKKLAVVDLQKIISTHIKSNLPVKVVRRQGDTTQKRGKIYMGGTYYSYYDAEDRLHIEIVLSYHPDDKFIRMTEYRWERICNLFADTILHEIIHMRQYRSRNFKTIPGYESTAHYHKQRVNQEYYGHKDEMGAFSFNIACELVDRFDLDKDAIKKYLDSMQAKRHKNTSYHKYLAAFEWNHSHPIVRSMKKKIIRNIDYAYAGKPFKTTNFLTY